MSKDDDVYDVCETAVPADGASRCSGRAAGEPGSEGNEAQAWPIVYAKATKGPRDETRSNPTGVQLPRAKGSCEGKKSGPKAPTHSGETKKMSACMHDIKFKLNATPVRDEGINVEILMKMEMERDSEGKGADGRASRCTVNEERHVDKTVRGSSGEKNAYLWAVYSHEYITMVKVVHFLRRHSGDIKKDLSCCDGMTTRNEHNFCRHTWMWTGTPR
ncbi:hypothetical protein DFH08DRAFT_807164 [Mycena albidolilacea]|uniref:Uncharacterized protein n=1 Tax=Mycena albidolilacea TaxID=1033008 RepID=A0AAD7ESM8_9AGAR|nr:hypothetical protein DFH08DRAFT_807164 [Mycena albidolilacea]